MKRLRFLEVLPIAWRAGPVTDAARVLVIDDDLDYCQIARLALEAAGLAVETAHSGQDGLEKARQSPPDLVILDAMMETPTAGFEFLESLRADPALELVPVIMLSAINQHTYPWRLERDRTLLPVDTFLDKPVPTERLVAEARRLLERRG